MKTLFVILSLVAVSLSVVSCEYLKKLEEKAAKGETTKVAEPAGQNVGTTAQVTNPNEVRVYSNAYDGFVNVRAQPSAKSAKLGKLKNGNDYLEKLGVQGKWIKVKWQNTVGYVDSSLVGHTPWKPVTLSIDANSIEGQYSMNHSDLFIFSNGRYICFYNCGDYEYGVWRFEGNEIVYTTKHITSYGEYLKANHLCDSYIGRESRGMVDENGIGGMFKCELKSTRELIAEYGENYGEGDGETIIASKEDFLAFKKRAAKLVSLK